MPEWWSWFSFVIGVIVGIPVTCGIVAVITCIFSTLLTKNDED